MTPPITTVFFDLGDTLWHFPNMPPREFIRKETVRRLRELLATWGHHFEGERFYLGRDIRLAVEEETSRAFHGDCVDPNYPELCRRVAARHDLSLTREQSEELWEAWNLGGAFLGRELFPDVLPTLQWLKERSYRLGAVTNRGYSGPRFHEEMRDLGLTDLFESTVVSCEIGYMKPHPRIFQYALKSLGAAAEETAMVGDSLHADVEGAKTLGMTAIWRRPVIGEPLEMTEDEPEPGPAEPDYTVESIGDLKSLPLFAGAMTPR
ncbi:MAG: HAD family hydrolase [Chloroflexi bacterium]|nr:MAG: HAD family hydrolase [Chloroflexota bacterium]